MLHADDRWAPQAVAGPVNQLVVSGNACGPAALLASFRCGGDDARKVAAAIPGSSDRSKLLYIIRAHGMKPSVSLRDRPRWSRHGINPEDLGAIATELAAIGGDAPPRYQSLLARQGTPGGKTLRRAHDLLRDSLVRGFPPVVALRRHALREGQWQWLDGHFVSVVRVPEKLDRSATSFTLTYFEPWGGRKLEATLAVPDTAFLGGDIDHPVALAFIAPAADIGKAKVRKGETTIIAPTMSLVR